MAMTFLSMTTTQILFGTLIIKCNALNSTEQDLLSVYTPEYVCYNVLIDSKHNKK